MFHAQRWAGAFLSVSGADANEAFLCIKALAAQVKTAHGALFGHSASAKLEKILRESSNLAHEETPAVEYAIRLLCLLVEKNCFRHVDLLLQKIERDLDDKNGIVNVTLESAAPVENGAAVEGGLEEKLTLIIKEKTGAAGVKMKTRVRPELLGGYILRIGSHYIDASLKGQLENMAAQLSTPSPGANTGGRNG